MAVMLILGITTYGQYNPGNPEEPGAYYKLTLKCVPEEAGSFNINAVTTQSEGAGVNLRAYTNSGYRFLYWECAGKQLSASASFNYKMAGSNTTLLAVYEKYYNPNNPGEPSQPNLPRYTTLDVRVSPSSAGSVNVSASNKYEIGSSVKLQAYANTYYHFLNWTQDGEVISTATSFNYVVKENNSPIIANYSYSYDPSNPGEPGKPTFQRKLILSCNPEGAGYFNINSGNTYTNGSSVTLRAYANKDYEFQNWTIDGEVISDNYSISYTMPETDAFLVANYKYTWEYKPGNPGEPNSPEDQDLSIYGLSETIYPGQTINYPIYLRNNQEVYGLLIDVKIPDGFSVDWNALVLSGRCNGHEITHESVEDGYVRLSLNGESPFASDNGKIIDIPLTSDVTIITEQEYEISLPHGVVILKDNVQVPVMSRNGTVKVETAADGYIYARYSYDKFHNRVKFTNQSAPDVIAFEWDFGDGERSTSANPLHIYENPGTYKVTLTVSNSLHSATYEQQVLINDESTWDASGNFYLSSDANGLRNFTTYSELLKMLSESRISGTVIINVESGKTFSCDMDDENVSYLRNIYNKLHDGKWNLIFAKSGNNSNPILAHGFTQPISVDKTIIDLFVKIGGLQECTGVEIKLWGINFDASQLSKLVNQDICTGIRSQSVSFALISTDLQFSWSLEGIYEGLTGAIKNGTGAIPSMDIVNEGHGDANMTYNVIASYEGKEFISFPVYMTVHPALVGIFSELTPKNETKFENTNVNLTWNNIDNAYYDVYLWNVNESGPSEPIIESTPSLRASVSKNLKTGNRYKWYVRAHNSCQEIYSDTLTFQIGSLPDLHVSKLEVGDAVAGKELTVSWTVTNDGNGSTGNVQWSDNIWLVPDVYVGTNSVYLNTQTIHPRLLRTVANIKALNSGESYNNSVKIQLEERVSGNYWIIVCSDMHDVKNIKWQTVNNTVPNPYTPSVSGSPYHYLYAETSASGNKISEANETSTRSDNFNYAKINISIPGLVDLTVPEIVASVDNSPGVKFGVRVVPSAHTTIGLAESKEFYSGKHLKVTATIKNVGAKKLERTTFANVLYMSHSATYDNVNELIPLSSQNHTTFLDPDGTTKITFDAWIPFDWFGETYFYVYTDVNDQVYELASKQNNWGQSAKYDFKLTPCADFKISDLKTGTTIAPQTQFNFSYNVKNIGQNIPTTSSVWQDCFYLSKKDTFDETAVLVGQKSQAGYFSCSIVGSPGGNLVIPATDYAYSGDNYSVNHTLTIDKIEEGDYYLYVKVDGEDAVYENGREDNNILRSGPISCRVPDLQIELVSVESDTIVTNKPVALSWIITNTGSGIVKNLKVKDLLYASKNQDGADAILLGVLENELFINPGEQQTLRANVTIPQNARLDGVLYIFMKTNTDKAIRETDYDNNQTGMTRAWFKYLDETEKPAVIKGTNVGIADLAAPSSGSPGEEIIVSYTLTNDGNKKVDTEIPQAVYISARKEFDTTAKPCKITYQQGSSINLGAEDATNISLKIEIPENVIGGSKYLHLFIDKDNILKESYTSDNHTYWDFYLQGNLPSLKAEYLVMPDTIMTSTDVNISWKIKNVGEWQTGSFDVGLYRGNELLSKLNVKGLAKGDSITQNAKINIADKDNGKWNFSIIPDINSDVVQLSDDRRSISKPVVVELAPVPDLCITSLSTDGTAWSGQKLNIKTTFANHGLHKTRVARWSEDYYLAQSNILNLSTATKIGSRVHNGALEAGADYVSTMGLTVPPNVEGNYMLFAVIDGGNSVYESDENNNYRSIPVFINGRTVCATDLSVTNISAPSTINAGELFSLSYKINNNGEFKASGMCREVLYLSTDNVLDADDQMVGTVSGDIDIAPGGSLTRTATGRISNVTEGSYYLIVKTNSTRSIAEIDNDNNSAVLASQVKINFPSISLNGSASFKTSGYYKLNIPAGSEGKTVGFYLDQSKDDTGGLYVAYDKVPTSASYDECSTRPRVDRQEVIIPDVRQGNYYILAQDNSAVVNKDNFAFSLSGSDNIKQIPLTLSAKELHFGASSLSITEGGNGGWISTNIKGAMLDSIMDFRLVNKNVSIPVEILHYKGSTSTVATFNLNDVELGSYDVVSELADGTQATLKNGFTVVPATSVNVEVKLDGPSTYRLNSYSPMSLAYFNNGTNDVELYEFMLTIDDGYIAATYDELDRNRQKVLHFRPDYERNSRGFISLPPGERCVLNFFIKTGSNSENNVSVYIVK